MRKPKIKFNKVKPQTNMANVLISIAKFGDISRVYTKNKRLIINDISRLKKRGLIKPDVLNKKNGFLLTKDGFIEFLKLEISQTDLLTNNKECMVVFDIPETSKPLREILTFFLEESCFIRIQKSVWVSQFDASERLSEIFYLLGIDKWIKVFIVEEIKHKSQNNGDRRYSATNL